MSPRERRNRRSREWRRAKYRSDPEYRRTENMRSCAVKLGITLEEYQKLSATTVCGICECELSRKGNRKLCVDHCHVTRKVRGVICQRCNLTLGMLGDSAEAAAKFVSYLKGSE